MKNRAFLLLLTLSAYSLPLQAAAYETYESMFSTRYWLDGTVWTSNNPGTFPDSSSAIALVQGNMDIAPTATISLISAPQAPPQTITLHELLVSPIAIEGGLTEVVFDSGEPYFQSGGTFAFNQGDINDSGSIIAQKSPQQDQEPFAVNFDVSVTVGTGGSGFLSISSTDGETINFDGGITGNGGILIPSTSTSSININSHCTYTGGTIINGGNLTMGADGWPPTNSNVTINGGTFTINTAAPTTLRNLTGTGGLLNLASAQAFTLAPNTTANYQGSISGVSGATLIISEFAGGTQILSGTNTAFLGEMKVDGGRLQINAQNNLGGGLVTLADSGTLAVAQTTTISRAINIPLGTISAAAGTTTTLSGSLTSTGGAGAGNLTIGAGPSSGTVSLADTATVTLGTVTVAPGATLTGTGTITSTTTTVKGTVSPGNSPGILPNTGNWTQDTGSTYVATTIMAPEDPGTIYTYPYTNLLDITGNLDIQPGSIFQIDIESFYYPNRYSVINYTGNLTGRFDTIKQGSPIVVGALSYDEANQIILSLSYEDILGDSISKNAQDVAIDLTTVFFSGSSAIDTILDDLTPLTHDQREYALDQMHPAPLKSSTLAQQNNCVAVNSALSQRFQTLLNMEQARPLTRSSKQKSAATIAPTQTELKQNEPLTTGLPVLHATENNDHAIITANGAQDLEAELEGDYAVNDGQVTIELITSPPGDFETAAETGSLAMTEGNPDSNQASPVESVNGQVSPEAYQAAHIDSADSNEPEAVQEIQIELEQEESPKQIAAEPVPEVEEQTVCKLNKKPFTIWVSGLGDFLHQSNVFFKGSPQVGYEVGTGGLVGGADYNFGNYYFIGALGALTRSDLTLNSNHGRGDIASGYAGLYLSAIGQLFYGNLSVIGAWTDYNAQRNIIFPGVSEMAFNNHHGKQIISHIDTGLNFNFMGFTIRPFDAFDFIAQHENGFVETGAGIYNLSVEKTHANMLRNELGAHLAYNSCFSKVKASIDTKFSWVREIRTTGDGFISTFVAVNSPFAVTGYFPNRNLFSCGASLSAVTFDDRLTYTAYYNGVFGSHYSDNGFGGQISFGF